MKPQKVLTMDAASKPQLNDLLAVTDLTPDSMASLLELASAIKARPSYYRQALAGKQVVLFFEKPSLRTRLTFEAGVQSMGGASFFFDQTQTHLGTRESIADMAHNLERWVDAIVLRTFWHNTVTEMAKHANIPVINGLSDFEHPCQALADYLTLQEHFGDLKKVTLAYLGDGNNMAHSLMLCAAMTGGTIRIATPKGYAPDTGVIASAQEIATRTGAIIEITTDPKSAAKGAKAVYTDVWASMGEEDEAEERKGIFKSFQVNEAIMNCAASNAVFMHCLPAHRGDEVTSAVIDGERSVVFDQAENRLHVQKAALVMLLSSEAWRIPPRKANK